VRGSSLFPLPFLLPLGKMGNVGKPSHLGLVLGAELAAGLGLYLGGLLNPLVGAENCGSSLSVPRIHGRPGFFSSWRLGSACLGLFLFHFPVGCSWQLFLSHSSGDAMSLFGCNDSAMSLQ
jgi:hypothetical protein